MKKIVNVAALEAFVCQSVSQFKKVMLICDFYIFLCKVDLNKVFVGVGVVKTGNLLDFFFWHTHVKPVKSVKMS